MSRATCGAAVLVLVISGAGCGDGASGTTTTAAAASTTPSVSTITTTTGALQPSEPEPFSVDDLPALVFQPDEGAPLADGLVYRSAYSGTADALDVRHWALIPPEWLEEAGFVGAYSAIFLTDDFISTFGQTGQSLLTAALLFETPDGASELLRRVGESQSDLWEDVQSLPPVADEGFGFAARVGSDNVTVTYPTIGFGMRVGNVYIMIGSQGGSEAGQQPLPVELVRSVAESALTRTQAAMPG